MSFQNKELKNLFLRIKKKKIWIDNLWEKKYWLKNTYGNYLLLSTQINRNSALVLVKNKQM